MVDAGQNSAPIEQRSDLGDNPAASVEYWMMQLRLVERQEGTWVIRGRSIVKRYRDERMETPYRTASKYNVLWSNTETLKPWLYSQLPTPSVERRFKDSDPKGRFAAQVLERVLTYEDDSDEFDDMMRAVVQDRLLPGRGVARVRYVPHYGDPIQPDETPEEDDEGNDEADAEAEQGWADGQAASGAGAMAGVMGDDQPPQPSDSPAPPLSAKPNPGPFDGRPTAQANPFAAVAQPPVRPVVWEEVKTEYVFWEDFRCSPARRWKEVTWVAFRSYLTRGQLCERFGQQIGEQVSLDHSPGGQNNDNGKPVADAYKKGTVWEIWDKTRRETVWISPSYSQGPLDRLKDPLQLQEFFPCPMPIYATTTNDQMIPVPDYVEYQDQAIELDNLTARLTKLTQACKVVGVYAGSDKAVLSQVFATSTENQLIPVDDWIAFAQKGGITALIEWVPIQQIAAVIVQLYQAREQVKGVIYEVTGLADIVRANTNPEETATAQKLKSNFATMRLTQPQKDVARFARDMIRLKGEIISRHFAPSTISLMSGFPEPMPDPPAPPSPPGANAMQDPQQVQEFVQAQQLYEEAMQAYQAEQAKRAKNFMDACALLKADAGRGFRIDIETDSTVAADDQQQKADAVEFLTEITTFMEKVIPAVSQQPEMAPLMGEMIMFAVRNFKAGRSLEEKFQEAVDAMVKAASSPKPPPQDPKLAAVQAQAVAAQEKTAAETQTAQQKIAADTQVQMAKVQVDHEKVQAESTIAAADMIARQSDAVRVLQ